jgi:hypothetical protein
MYAVSSLEPSVVMYTSTSTVFGTVSTKLISESVMQTVVVSDMPALDESMGTIVLKRFVGKPDVT